VEGGAGSTNTRGTTSLVEKELEKVELVLRVLKKTGIF